MQSDREAQLAWEERWAIPVALSTLVAIALVAVATVIFRSIGADGSADVLTEVEEQTATVGAAGAMQAVAFLLLVAPLVYLFRAARMRTEKVRGQLIGLVVAAPLFLAVAAVLTTAATTEAASDFASGEATAGLTAEAATGECRSDREADAEAFREGFGTGRQALRQCVEEAVADDRAEAALQDTPLRSASTGFGLAGRIGLAFALLYCGLWAMRTGLLTRFWGSLGMAMGAAALLLLVQFTLVWFLYLALLVAGWLPGGRPPAWAAGEAIPWPTPGEEAAGGREGENAEDGEEDRMPDLGEPEAERTPGGEGERRKRKHRD